VNILVLCPHCRSRTRVARNTSGRTVRCTGCEVSFTVPQGAGDLTVEWGPVGAGRRFALAPSAPFRIGRARDNNLILPGTLVSRHHARLDWADGEWRVTDLESANGTFVNGRRIQTIGLTDGSRIVIGEFALRLALTTAGTGEPDAPLDAMALDESVAGLTAVVESAGPRGAPIDPNAETIRGSTALAIGEGPSAELPVLLPAKKNSGINLRRIKRPLIALALLLLCGGLVLAIRHCR